MSQEVELTIEEIMDNQFSTAASKLAQMQLPMKASYWFAKILKKIMQEQKNYHKARLDRLNKFCELDENGLPKQDDKGSAIFSDPIHKESFIKENEQLLAEKVKIQTMPLSYLTDDPGLKIEAGILVSLEKLLVEEQN